SACSTELVELFRERVDRRDEIPFDLPCGTLIRQVVLEPDQGDTSGNSIQPDGQEGSHDSQAANVITSVSRAAIDAGAFHLGIPILEPRRLLPPESVEFL